MSACVSLGSKPQRREKENPVQIDFIYWDQDFGVWCEVVHCLHVLNIEKFGNKYFHGVMSSPVY